LHQEGSTGRIEDMRISRTDPADFACFLALAKHRSFCRAGLKLGVSASALSHSLKGLEARWSEHAVLARQLFGDDAAKIIETLKAAIRAGAAPADLSRSLAYGAALRLARFGNTNENSDWETAHHVFTFANAVDQMLRRIGTANTDGHAMRSVLHGLMALYLARYLNVPPARIPGEDGEQLDDLPADAEMIRAALLDAFDRQQQVDLAAQASGTISHARPSAAGAPHWHTRCYAKMQALCLSDFGGGMVGRKRPKAYVQSGGDTTVALGYPPLI
jgi:hypothetical protein